MDTNPHIDMLNSHKWKYKTLKSKVTLVDDNVSKKKMLLWRNYTYNQIDNYYAAFKIDEHTIDICVKFNTKNGVYCIDTENVKTTHCEVNQFDMVIPAVENILNIAKAKIESDKTAERVEINRQIAVVKARFGEEFNVEETEFGFHVSLNDETTYMWVSVEGDTVILKSMPAMRMDDRSAVQVIDLMKYHMLKLQLSEG